MDEATANAILANSVAEFRRTLGNNETRGIPNLATSICGWTSVLTLLNITENMPGIHYHSIQYMNSGDADIGDKSRVVGYHAITVTLDNTNLEKETLASYELSNQEKAKLLRIAREERKSTDG